MFDNAMMQGCIFKSFLPQVHPKDGRDVYFHFKNFKTSSMWVNSVNFDNTQTFSAHLEVSITLSHYLIEPFLYLVFFWPFNYIFCEPMCCLLTNLRLFRPILHAHFGPLPALLHSHNFKWSICLVFLSPF